MIHARLPGESWFAASAAGPSDHARIAAAGRWDEDVRRSADEHPPGGGDAQVDPTARRSVGRAPAVQVPARSRSQTASSSTIGRPGGRAASSLIDQSRWPSRPKAMHARRRRRRRSSGRRRDRRAGQRALQRPGPDGAQVARRRGRGPCRRRSPTTTAPPGRGRVGDDRPCPSDRLGVRPAAAGTGLAPESQSADPPGVVGQDDRLAARAGPATASAPAARGRRRDERLGAATRP